MASQELHIVTGAFGYSGGYIAARLLEAGHRVRTLTNSPVPPVALADAIEVHPFRFDDPDALTASLRGATVLYNTYWVRFNHRAFNQADAVRNTVAVFIAARRAGVERIVHVSITNPSETSALEYFRGKALLERALMESGLSYAILRPALLFGGNDVLVNNIAWILRRFPVFGVFGDGLYKLRPIHVDDLARLAVVEGRSRANIVIDAVGPETFTYRGLVRELANVLGVRRRIVPVPPIVGYLVGWAVGAWMGDVTLTRDEITGLMAGLLFTPSPPTGSTRLSEWARSHSFELGAQYASELARRNRSLLW
jgi:NADH dehydrogenase